MLRLRFRSLIPLLCFLVVPSLLAQTDTGMTATSLSSISTTDQAALVAPTASGETGLFTIITANTLRRGDWSFGVYYQNWDLEAARAPFDIPSARSHKNMGYDLYRLSASAGYGLTDNWEISASVPFDRLTAHGGDRNGFINGYYYQGKFSDSGMGPLHLASDPQVNAKLINDPKTMEAFMALPFPGATEAFFVDTIKRVSGVKVPTLVIWGEDDQLDPPETAKLLFAALTCKKQLEIIPGNGHAGHVDRNKEKVFGLTADWVLGNLQPAARAAAA